MTLLTQPRLDYLDAVRAIALILGIVFHASLSFMPIFIGWAVMDISTSNIVRYFVLISHSFRMELFFLIAGFFACMTLNQRGMVDFLKARLMRIALPFILGWFLLQPLLTSGWIMGAESLRGEVNIISALISGFNSLSAIPNGMFVGTHLWFLYYLLMVSALAVVLRFLLQLNSSIHSLVSRTCEHMVTWICTSKLGILAVSMPTVACLWQMSYWGMVTPDKSLMPNIPVLLVYGVFFLFGWLLNRQSGSIDEFGKLSWSRVVLCLLVIVSAAMLSAFEAQPGHEYYAIFKASFLFSYAIMMWTLVALSIGICKYLFSQSNQFVRYIADSSYWLYLIHLPIVVWLQIAVAELPWHWTIKLTSICAVTLFLSLVIYDLCIRPTVIGRVLNGKRKSSVLFGRIR